MNERLNWIDIAKAIGIVLVVIAHSIPEVFLKLWIYTFHMPLFFFISGIFINFNIQKKESNEVFYLKKTRSILLPYIYFGIINTLLLIPVWGINSIYEGLKYVGISGGPTWFLLSLFLSEVFIFVLIRKIKLGIRFFTIMILALFVGYFLAYNNIKIAFYLSNIFVSIFFVGLGLTAGNLLLKHNDKIANKGKYLQIKLIVLTIAIISFVLNYYIASITQSRLDIIENKLGEPITMITGAITGIVFILSFSLLLSYIKLKPLHSVLSYLGKSTLIIFGLHMIVNLNYTVYAKPLFSSNILYISSKFIVTWLLMILFVYLINNYAAWMIGKKQIKHV